MYSNKITILYGSQTGNAEDMSKRIGYSAKSLGYQVVVEAIDDFKLTQLPKQELVVFVCSTTGHGQEPENMKRFYNFIRRRDLPKDCLKDLHFAVYGLGDSSYTKFNYVSKIIYKRLLDCGAKALQELTMGDEQHPLGCDGIIYPKLDELWLKFERGRPNLDLEVEEKSNHVKLPGNSYRVKMYSSDNELQSKPETIFNQSYITKCNINTAICTVNQRLTSTEHFQDTRLFCFKCDNQIFYEPGDVCAILPENLDEDVEQFLNLLNLNPNQRFRIEKTDCDFMIDYLYDFIPEGLRIYDLVKCYLDIQSVPKRSFFEFLWPFSDNDLERDKLREFATTEGQAEMYEYCIQPKRSILEVLIDFPHTVKNIKFDYIFDLIPPIKARSFSIASALTAHPNELHLIVGVVKYQTRMRKTRRGLCSTYLSKLIPTSSRIKFTIKQTSFKLPRNKETPIVMIGPGLGIAPFRSFIQERASTFTSSSATSDCLYFGCRYKEADFYFREELEQYSKDGVLALSVAFSREGKKQYIQDLLLEDAALVRDLIVEKSAVIYVAGNSKLPEDLRNLFAKILDTGGDASDESKEGLEIVTKLEAQRKIQYDCW